VPGHLDYVPALLITAGAVAAGAGLADALAAGAAGATTIAAHTTQSAAMAALRNQCGLRTPGGARVGVDAVVMPGAPPSALV
jgi:hypothetical protein